MERPRPPLRPRERGARTLTCWQNKTYGKGEILKKDLEREKKPRIKRIELLNTKETRDEKVKKGRTGDALALRGDEGRDKLRKAAGRRKWP